MKTRSSIKKYGLMIIVILTLVWCIGSIIWVAHAHSKFKACQNYWETAFADNNKADMAIFFRCQELAHEDTGNILYLGDPIAWIQHWNTDYVEQAQRELR